MTWRVSIGKVLRSQPKISIGEYLRYTTHVGFDTQTVYKAWTTNVTKRYADCMSRLSKESVKPDDESISDSNWAAWTRYWKTPKFKVKSDRGSSNQNRHGKGNNIHTSGSEIFSEKLKRSWANNDYPDPTEFHKRTHTLKGQHGVFCDDHASNDHTEYVSKEK